MFVLGVTGPSGAGKGTACDILKEHGFYHIDTDRLVPDLYPKALPYLVDAFGPQIAEDGAVNRKALAKAAFSSREATKLLNSILHPLVMEKVSELIQEAESNGYFGATVDGAALHEANAETVCDKMICILAPKETRLRRVISRDGISEDAAELRFQAQKSDEFYSAGTDAVIVNRTVEQLKYDLLSVIKEWIP